MSGKKNNSRKRKSIIKTRHLLLFFLALFVTAGIFFYNELSTDVFQSMKDVHHKKGAERETAKQASQHAKMRVPEVAIVIDDLGPSRKPVLRLFEIKAPITLSVLPGEPHSAWIADEGHRLGYDVIAHIPMEAKEPQKLGEGGLYTWMTDEEIRDTLSREIELMPYIDGVSNHMGSAFTEDERSMKVLMTVLKERGLFFLDSLTTSRSVGENIARAKEIRLIKRDIFLDNNGSQSSLEAGWKKLIGIAHSKGRAIALAHPKESTIEFLEKALRNNEVKVVPLSKISGISR
ncbi:MAG: divergent polysaccharide deacetylase family protein [Nitrospirota bacterium]